MKLVVQALVLLPFTMDFCAVGSEISPVEWQRGSAQFVLQFPPSLSEGTCGKSIFPNGWAWWTGERIVIEASLPLAPSDNDLEALRNQILQDMNQAVRLFLNSCRQRLHRPDIYPVAIGPNALSLALEYEDGRREALPEPSVSSFFRSLPAEPPLDRSINEATIAQIRCDLEENNSPSLAEQLALDAEWLRDLGELERAEAIEKLIASEA